MQHVLRIHRPNYPTISHLYSHIVTGTPQAKKQRCTQPKITNKYLLCMIHRPNPILCIPNHLFGRPPLAKQFDPEGSAPLVSHLNCALSHIPLSRSLRVTGVLIKPNRIFFEEESWLQLIHNEVEPILNNWYCAKRPNSDMIKDGIDWAGARRHENEFFAMTQPWCHLPSDYQSFLRTTKLTDRLSTILAELIAKRCDSSLDFLIVDG